MTHRCSTRSHGATSDPIAAGGRWPSRDRPPAATSTGSARPAAACSRRPTAASTGLRQRQVLRRHRRRHRRERVQSRHRVRRHGRVRHPRQRVARRRRVQDHRRREDVDLTSASTDTSRSRASASIRTIPTLPTSGLLATCGRRTPSAACSRPPTAARLGRRSSSGTTPLASPTWSMDPTDPDTLYAAFWQAGRKPWMLVSGGAGSGIFKTTDGGEHWTELTRNPGMPHGHHRQHRPRGLAGESAARVGPRRGRLGRRLSLRRRRRRPGRARTASASCASARGTTRGSTPIQRTRTRCTR